MSQEGRSWRSELIGAQEGRSKSKGVCALMGGRRTFATPSPGMNEGYKKSRLG